MPPEKELARQIVAVIGAGTGIGKAAALPPGDGRRARRLRRSRRGGGAGRPPARSRQVRSGHRRRRDGPLRLRPGHRARLRHHGSRQRRARCSRSASWPTAASTRSWSPPACSCRRTAPGASPTSSGRTTFDVNVTGAVHRRRRGQRRSCERQGLPANLVLTTSVNAVVAKKGSLAYDTSKAAANHLVRELAVELAPLVRVNARRAGDGRQGQHDVPARPGHRVAREVQIAFARRVGPRRCGQTRGLLRASARSRGSPIEPDDQAEAVSCCCRAGCRKTTGHVIPVDGGLQDGFLDTAVRLEAGRAIVARRAVGLESRRVRDRRARALLRQGGVRGRGAEAAPRAARSAAPAAGGRRPRDRAPGRGRRRRQGRDGGACARVARPARARHARLRPPTDEERERPRWWRFWMRLPARTSASSSARGTASRSSSGLRPLRAGRARPDAVRGRLLRADARRGRSAHRQVLAPPRRRRGPEARCGAWSEDPETRWRVTQTDWKHFRKLTTGTSRPPSTRSAHRHEPRARGWSWRPPTSATAT